MSEQGRVRATRLLAQAREGDAGAAAELLPLIYQDLRAIAASFLRRERAGHTLEPTALVHEAYIRLADVQPLGKLDRLHYRAVAAGVMRRILVDHARARATRKRSGDRVTLALSPPVAPAADLDVLELEEALEKLASLDSHHARLVELRFFSGLTVEEVAKVLGRSKRAVELDWTLARAFLRRELEKGSR